MDTPRPTRKETNSTPPVKPAEVKGGSSSLRGGTSSLGGRASPPEKTALGSGEGGRVWAQPAEPVLPRQAAKLRDPTAGMEIAPGVRVLPEILSFSFVRSSGPGGQNVNKVATKAVLRVRVLDLPIPNEAAARLRAAAGYRLVGTTPNDELLLSAEKNRSQEANKDQTLADLRQLLVAAMKRPTPRRATKPSRGAKMRRLDGKKRRSETKQQRRSVD